MIFGVFLVIYIVSVVGAYFETRRMYREDYKYIKPDMSDVFMVLCPYLNTIVALFYPHKIIKRKLSKQLKKRGLYKKNLLARLFGVE